MAEKTGASVENLSALASVAKVSGVDIDLVDSALQKLVKSLQGTGEESKGAAAALEALGLSADELRQMDTAEAMIKFIIKSVMEKCPDEIAFFNSFVDKGLAERLTHVMTSDFVRVSYTEAVDILKKSGHQFEYPVDWGCDLATEHERFLT